MKIRNGLITTTKLKLAVVALTIAVILTTMNMATMTSYAVGDEDENANAVTVGTVELEDGEYTINGLNKTHGVPTANYAYFKDGVLNLNDFTLTEENAGIYATKGNLNVVLVGNNRIQTVPDRENAHALYAKNGDLTIDGSGSLVASAYGTEASAIFTNNGNLNIKGGTITASSSGTYCSAIYAYNSSYDEISIDNAMINISGGTIEATASGTNSSGIGCDNIITVSGGEITATGDMRALNPMNGTIDLSHYACKEKIASVNVSGTPTTTFDEDSYMTYKYVKLIPVQHIHNWETSWTRDETYHWHKCSDCTNVKDKALHTYDKGVVTTAPTTASKGVMTYTCICGATKSEEIAALKPEITKGSQNQWSDDSKEGLSFTSNGVYKDFIGVIVDGKTVAKDNYDVKEGSIIVTLKPEYLATLASGKHTLIIESKTGQASTEFTIKKAEKDESIVDEMIEQENDKKTPETGDSNDLRMLVMLVLTASGIMVAVKVSEKRKSK